MDGLPALEILVNGKTCLINTSGDPAFRKPYIVSLTQMMGIAPTCLRRPGTVAGDDGLVDYVRVWQ